MRRLQRQFPLNQVLDVTTQMLRYLLWNAAFQTQLFTYVTSIRNRHERVGQRQETWLDIRRSRSTATVFVLYGSEMAHEKVRELLVQFFSEN